MKNTIWLPQGDGQDPFKESCARMPVQKGLCWVRIRSFLFGVFLLGENIITIWTYTQLCSLCQYPIWSFFLRSLFSSDAKIRPNQISIWLVVIWLNKEYNKIMCRLAISFISYSQLTLYADTSKHGVSRAAEVWLHGKWFLNKRDFLWKHSVSAPSLVLWTDNKPCDDGGEDRGRSSAFRLV